MILMYLCIVIFLRYFVKYMYFGVLQEFEGFVDLFGFEFYLFQGFIFLYRYMFFGCGICDWMDECDERFFYLFV